MSVVKAVKAVRELVKDHGGRCKHTDAVRGSGAPLPSVVLAGVVAEDESPEVAGKLLAELRRATVLPGLFEGACVSLLTKHGLECEAA